MGDAMPERRGTDVAVIGAGISGLALAYYLVGKGLNVRVIERGERVGGAIRTTRANGFLIEHGPSALLESTPLLHRLFTDLRIESFRLYASSEARYRYIVRGGALHPLPTSPPGLVASKLFSARAKARLLSEPFAKPAPKGAEETLAAFVERRLGREFLDYGVNPFAAGVYAGVPEELSASSAFPWLYSLEQKHGSILKGAILAAFQRRRRGKTSMRRARLFSFREGLQTLIDALEERLGGAIHAGANLKSVHPTDGGYLLDLKSGNAAMQLDTRSIAFTIPAHAYAKMEFPFDFPIGSALEQIHYPPVAVVFCGYKKHPGGRPLDGFGFLVPQCEQRQILGTIWNSTLFPGRAPEGGAALTTFVGGVRQPENATLPDGLLIDVVRKELEYLLGIQASPDEVQVVRWPRAIPQYRRGYKQFVTSLEAFEAKHPRLYFGGNFRGGISVPDCIEHSRALGDRIAGDLGNPPCAATGSHSGNSS